MENSVPSEIILLCNDKNDRMSELTDIFDFLQEHKIGKRTKDHYCCPSSVQIPANIGLDENKKKLFNTIQVKSQLEGAKIVCFCLNIQI